MSDTGHEISWDGVIENDSPEFVILPEGDYSFEVAKIERARHSGSEKLPACGKATVHIKVEGEEGVAIIKHNLFLHSVTEGMLCAFFAAIGQRRKGQKATMDWSRVVGSKGMAKVGIKKWTNDEGREIVTNEIKKFYDPEAPTKEAKGKVGYEPGKF